MCLLQQAHKIDVSFWPQIKNRMTISFYCNRFINSLIFVNNWTNLLIFFYFLLLSIHCDVATSFRFSVDDNKFLLWVLSFFFLEIIFFFFPSSIFVIIILWMREDTKNQFILLYLYVQFRCFFSVELKYYGDLQKEWKTFLHRALFLDRIKM